MWSGYCPDSVYMAIVLPNHEPSFIRSKSPITTNGRSPSSQVNSGGAGCMRSRPSWDHSLTLPMGAQGIAQDREAIRLYLEQGSEDGDEIAQSFGGSPDVVNRDDPWVVEAGQDAGLGQVGFDAPRGGESPGMGNLDGDITFEGLVVTAIDNAEAAAAEPGDDVIATEALG